MLLLLLLLLLATSAFSFFYFLTAKLPTRFFPLTSLRVVVNHQVGSVLYFPAVAQGSRAVDTLAVHGFVAGSCCFTAGSWLHWHHLPPPKPQ